MTNPVKTLDEMKWEVLSSQYMHKDTWMTVRVDSCKKPDGKIIEPYYVYEFPDWVTALAFTEDNKIILERQYRHALGAIHYELPGGCVDKSDASYEAAIARELLEETGYAFDSFTCVATTSANPSTNSNLMKIFIAKGGKYVQPPHWDEGEDIEIHLCTLDEVKHFLKTQQFIQSMHVTGLLYALQHEGLLHY